MDQILAKQNILMFLLSGKTNGIRGPPVGYPIQFRISGTDSKELLGISEQVESILRQNRILRTLIITGVMI